MGAVGRRGAALGAWFIRWLWRMGVVVLGIGVLGVASVALIRWHMLASTKAHRGSHDDAPHAPVVMVLGAAVWGDKPSHMLEDRLHTALQLYRAGQCERILVSGAHHGEANEGAVMRRWLEARGVPPRDIFVDHAGFRTLDSMVRARKVFGASELLVVSQWFHVPRAVYLARSFGLDAYGVDAEPLRRYSARTRAAHERREVAAQVRAFLDVYVLHTPPRVLGPPVDLNADGRVTH